MPGMIHSPHSILGTPQKAEQAASSLLPDNFEIKEKIIIGKKYINKWWQKPAVGHKMLN